MKTDDNSHYLIYRVLGITSTDGQLIDGYQNTGRFLYKYAGSFLEEAASLCLKFKNIDGGKRLVGNNQGQRPKTFEIDFLDDTNAIEIKWRDATTDGDHITKELQRMKPNKIYQGNSIKRLTEFDENSVDLIYLDPPFFTQKKHSLFTRDESKKYEFNDSWDSLDGYILLIESCLIECRRILKCTGSVFLHCDKAASHYLRVSLDKVFGIKNFRSEIIWSYKRWSNAKKGLLSSHQNTRKI